MRLSVPHIMLLCAISVVLAMPTQAFAKDFVVVIDAGHGGRDQGASGEIAKEKDINLSVAKLLGQMIDENIDGVKVIYTRSTDKYLTLQERADIANKAAGNLFISIHVNSIDKKAKNRTTIAGASVYTLGLHRTDENLEVAKRENSVIELEEDYSTTYSGFDPNSSESYIIFELNQDTHLQQSIDFASHIQDEFIKTAGRKDRGVRQAGFLVLAATSMPSVLVELDFICNPTQETYLNSAKGQKQLAKAIYNAFVQYKKKHDRLDSVVAAVDSTAADQPDQAVSDIKIYKIQILSSATPLKASDKRLKRLDGIDYYVDNGTYKYTYGNTSSWDKALQMLKVAKKQYPEAFIITTVNGKRIK